MAIRLMLAAVVLAGAGLWYASRPVVPPPGVLAPEAPRQAALDAAEPISHRGYRLTPVAAFEAEARVLGLRRYRDDAPARLAPYDLAIGWGPLSDTAVLEDIPIVQTQRVYTWRGEQSPLSTREIIRHSTNIHLVPANADAAAGVARLKAGHLVRLRGRLVDVLGPDGSRWRTSRSRTDAGVGACEILWLESVELL